MSFGFKVNDASGNTIIDSTETCSLLEERMEKTATGSGSKTYTGLTNQNAYVFGLCESNGNASAGTWTGVDFGLATSLSGGNPKVDWDISCTGISGWGSCSDWDKYHIFVFMK